MPRHSAIGAQAESTIEVRGSVEYLVPNDNQVLHREPSCVAAHCMASHSFRMGPCPFGSMSSSQEFGLKPPPDSANSILLEYNTPLKPLSVTVYDGTGNVMQGIRVRAIVSSARFPARRTRTERALTNTGAHITRTCGPGTVHGCNVRWSGGDAPTAESSARRHAGSHGGRRSADDGICSKQDVCATQCSLPPSPLPRSVAHFNRSDAIRNNRNSSSSSSSSSHSDNGNASGNLW